VAAQLWKADEGEPSRLFLTASYLTLFIGGVVLGIVGAFTLPRSVDTGFSAAVSGGGGQDVAGRVMAAGTGGGFGQLLSVGLLIAIVGNPALSYAGLRTAGTRLAALTPLIGWFLILIPMMITTSDGDHLLPLNVLRNLAFLLLGVLGFMAVAALGRPTRGSTAVLGQPLPSGPVRALPRKAPAKSAAKSPPKSSAARTAPKARKRR
jgi:hypothetical protein